MKAINAPRLPRIFAVLLLLVTPALLRGEKFKESIYNETANAATDVAAALATAKQENKRVLLQFGANWCPWCHRLHNLFRSDDAVAAELARSYVVVLVDVDKGRNADVDARYGHPIKEGLPVLVVLDADGKQLTTQETGALEKGPAHDPEKVLAFLKTWAPVR